MQIGDFCCFMLDTLESTSNLSTSARLKDFFLGYLNENMWIETLNEAKRTSIVLKLKTFYTVATSCDSSSLCGVINAQTVTHVSAFSEDECSALAGKLSLIRSAAAQDNADHKVTHTHTHIR